MDVAAWLCGLGLGQYEQAFRENDIDAEVLTDLTAEDLIGLGVTSIDHRRKFLAAIAALRVDPSPQAGSPKGASGPPSGSARPCGSGSHRDRNWAGGRRRDQWDWQDA